jgi:hypothetical protein
MTDRVLQRFAWNGEPREVAIWWTLRRGSGPQRAICRMFTHQFGHELRLEVKGQLVESRVCRTDEDVLTHPERWRAALEAKGWQK